MRKPITHVARLAVFTLTMTIAACGGYPLALFHGLKDLPDPNWPMTTDEVKQGVAALRYGFLNIDGAIKHLRQAVADNPCDASAHYYLAIAYAYGDAKTREDWDSAKERQSARLRGYPKPPLGAAFPDATAQFYDRLFEHQVGTALQPMRDSQSALMARAVQLRRGEVAQCKR